ncbi:MAG: WbqC family protein, partial [Candidatus Zixiibacteriota bacterium]
QDYHHPTYPQLYGAFTPYLSVIDLLFNCGKESLKIIIGEKAV